MTIPAISVTKRDSDSRTLLHNSQSASQTCSLLNQGAEINAVDDEGWTPLMIAASANRIDIVEILIENNANLDLQNSYGNTALHYAASKNLIDIVKVLLSSDAKLLQNSIGHTPLHRAAMKGFLDVLILFEKTFIDVADYQGNTALHLATEESRVDVIKYLIDLGANSSIRIRMGNWLLILLQVFLFNNLYLFILPLTIAVIA